MSAAVEAVRSVAALESTQGADRPGATTRKVVGVVQRFGFRVTEFKLIPDRGHSLIIDHGWREVADTALAFVKRFA